MTAVYESGSIRWFKYGRTDTIRSCTNASRAFVKVMMDKSSSVSINKLIFISTVIIDCRES